MPKVTNESDEDRAAAGGAGAKFTSLGAADGCESRRPAVISELDAQAYPLWRIMAHARGHAGHVAV